jgi:hypothetical protein
MRLLPNFCDILTPSASIICIVCLNEGSQFDKVTVFVCSCGICKGLD